MERNNLHEIFVISQLFLQGHNDNKWRASVYIKYAKWSFGTGIHIDGVK